MFLKLIMTNVIAKVMCSHKTDERLNRTCFRRTNLPLAGNFFYWRKVSDIIDDPSIRRLFKEQLEEIFKEDDSNGTHSFSVSKGINIGWSSTSPIKDFYQDDLEKFAPNKHSTALRVKADRRHLLAEKTSLVTFVIEVRSEHNKVIIHSVYPGKDIGELNGDITEREKRVFFDWEHPGDEIRNGQ